MIPFNKLHLVGTEFTYIQQAVEFGQLAGNGRFTASCQDWLRQRLGASRVLLTHSGTAALEMAALLLDLQAGDETAKRVRGRAERPPPLGPGVLGELAATRRTTRGAIGLTGVVDVAVDQLGQDRQTADAVGEHVVHYHR